MSHTNIYENLFRYRQRENRSPREDFLSVALTDLLNRLPANIALDAITKLFIPASELAVWNQLIAEQNRSWQWQAHVPISGGVIDMALMDHENEPILIIENKIAAPISRRALNAKQKRRTDGIVHNDNQLGVYGRWLAERRCSRWKGVLVLLTHCTATPSDFEDNDNKYGASPRHSCRWDEVWHWLLQHGHELEAQSKVSWRSLTVDLAALLEEWGMSSEMVTTKDVQALGDYLKEEHHVEKVRDVFDAIYTKIKPQLNTLRVKQLSPERHLRPISGSIFNQVELEKKAAMKGWVIEWGIAFPGGGFANTLRELGFPVPEGAYWYLGLFGYPDEDASGALPTWMGSPADNDWHFLKPQDNPGCEFGWFTLRSAAYFAKNEEISVKRIGEWFAAELSKVPIYAPALCR